MSQDHPIRTLSSEQAWSCRWYAVRRDHIQLPDGSPGEYNVIEMNDSVWVVPLTSDSQIALIYNYRYPLRAWCWEVPAGHVEPGQTPLDAARAELLEEAGGRASDYRLLTYISTLNGIGSHHGSFFLATGVELGQPQPEQSEAIKIQTFPIAEALAMARNGQINDAMSVTALLLAEPHLS